MTNEELVVSTICEQCICKKVCCENMYDFACDKYYEMVEFAEAKDEQFKEFLNECYFQPAAHNIYNLINDKLKELEKNDN